MALKLVPRKLASLGARLGIGDAACAAEDGPVEGEDSRSLDELGSGKSKWVSHGLRSQLAIGVLLADLHDPGSAPGRGEISALSHTCEGTATGPRWRASITDGDK